MVSCVYTLEPLFSGKTQVAKREQFGILYFISRTSILFFWYLASHFPHCHDSRQVHQLPCGDMKKIVFGKKNRNCANENCQDSFKAAMMVGRQKDDLSIALPNEIKG